MISYREHLQKIGIAPGEAVSYKEFYSRPRSLRRAIRSMNAPPSRQWDQVANVNRDDFWTDEVQGVAWNGTHWIFSTNANQKKPDVEDKAIYVFAPGSGFGDGDWARRIKYKDVPHPIAGTKESDCHWGQLTYHDGRVHVSQFWEGGPRQGESSIVVFKSEGASLSFERWVDVTRPPAEGGGEGGRVEFQGINPWDGLYYTYRGGDFFKHDLDGNYIGEKLILSPPPTRVQGACFSPNGHLYVASNETLPDDEDYQTIWYYSALNGHRFGVIPVLAKRHYPTDELEGICYADLGFDDDRRAQIHAVLLENPDVALDNIFFKSFSTADPEIV
jgi:hypothetical protein